MAISLPRCWPCLRWLLCAASYDHHTDQLHQAEKQIAEVRAVHHCDGHHEMSDLGADGEPVHSGAESGEPVWLHRAIGWVRSLA